MDPTTAISLRSLEDTRRAAETLARLMPADVLIALSGDLGAGKTTFVRYLAAVIGIDPTDITSPTFGLVHEHVTGAMTCPSRLVHIDAYRLSSPDDLAAIGWEEILADGGWIVVEWPERVAAALPRRRLDLSLIVTGDATRRLEIRPSGDWSIPPGAIVDWNVDDAAPRS